MGPLLGRACRPKRGTLILVNPRNSFDPRRVTLTLGYKFRPVSLNRDHLHARATTLITYRAVRILGRWWRTVARGRGYHLNLLCSTGCSPRVLTSHRHTGRLLCSCGHLHPSRRVEQARLLGGLLKGAKRGLVVRPPFTYSCKCGVRIKRGFCTGIGLIVLSKTGIYVKSGTFVTPGINVCATKRPLNTSSHGGNLRCTCPVAVNGGM